ncbi:hypothetical protein [Pseudomonas sp. Q1-7]|uniref:hypothetical protein n=1 Tax=Pseudomonas sp. Q1-7 TaxID=3020843 RepID=UPI0023015E03|nr:hypothetical protein [Pseudomonas sp. Q1-7]
MEVNVYTLEEISNSQLLDKIKKRESFVIQRVDPMRFSSAIDLIEKTIDGQGLKFRTYTIGRVATAGATIFGGVTGALGLLSGIAIAAHNIVTWNPDYEIGKSIFNASIYVTYKK